MSHNRPRALARPLAAAAIARIGSVAVWAKTEGSPPVRMLLKFQMDVEAANRSIRDGSWAAAMDRVMQGLQPEAAYFTAMDGKRTGLIVFDLKEPSQIPVIAEPIFMAVNASIELSPVMTLEDVEAGLQEAAKAF